MDTTDITAYDSTGYVFAACDYVPLDEEKHVTHGKSEIFTVRFPLITQACDNLLASLEEFSKDVACEPFAVLYFRKWLVNLYGGTEKQASELGSPHTEVFGGLFTAIKQGDVIAEYAGGKAEFSRTFSVPEMNAKVCAVIANGTASVQNTESFSGIAGGIRTLARHSINRYSR